MEVPFTLSLGADPSAYAPALWALLALFIARVAGQVIVVLRHPAWLPEMKQRYSGLLPYPVLLPIQIVYIVVMTWIAVDFTREAGAFVVPRPALGAVLVWMSYVYAAGMVLRFILWLRTPPAERRAWIPIIFHIVLAAFLWVFASWHALQR